MRIKTSMVLGRVADSIGEESSSVNEVPSRVNEVPSSVNEGPSSVIEGSSSSTRSVFDALKAPTLSDLTWKRSVHCNLPPKGKHRALGERSSEPKSITASQRVIEFLEECLKVSGAGKSKLFCKVCHEELSLCYNRNNERIIGQICWNNRENDVEIWNRIIGKFFGTIGSALVTVAPSENSCLALISTRLGFQ